MLSKQPANLHDNLLSESFYGKCCQSKLWKKHLLISFCLFLKLLCVYLGFCLFDFVGMCVLVCVLVLRWDVFLCVFVCLQYGKDWLFAFVSAGGVSTRTGASPKFNQAERIK